MNAHTQRRSIAGPSGALECAIDAPAGVARGLAVICHPHPQHGGTMDNKVVQTLARALTQLGYTALRFNFRGVGGSAGGWSQGPGEVDDALAVVAAFRGDADKLVLAGFSFGAYVASQAAARLASAGAAAERLVLIAPAASCFDMASVPSGTLVVHCEPYYVLSLSAVFLWSRPSASPVTVISAARPLFPPHMPTL